MRQLVLDTETTGLEVSQGHRVIEIGCVELVDRRLTGNNFHCYLNPDREIDAAAQEVHGLDQEFLGNKPKFHEIAEKLNEFLDDSALIIHNAEFDVGFLDAEFSTCVTGFDGIGSLHEVIDTLSLARQLHPGQKNNLDALCKRYGIDNSHRTLHGALLDAEILADVYLAMTGGQTTMFAESSSLSVMTGDTPPESDLSLNENREGLVLLPDENEINAHEKWMELLGDKAVWHRYDG